MILWVLPWWLHDWRGKKGATGGRESMSSRVYRLVKFIPFHHTLKWLSPCNTHLVFNQIWVILPFARRDFDFISFFLHKKGLLVISSWKGVWYILRGVEMIRNMYILWDMVFVICMEIICRYFVGHGSFIYIYIYIYTHFERHGI